MTHKNFVNYFCLVGILGIIFNGSVLGNIMKREILNNENNEKDSADSETPAEHGMEGRIVGGKEAMPNQFPWQVSLRFIDADRHFCGGAVYNSHYVITAAHCFFEDSDTSWDVNNIKIVAGDHNVRTHDPGEQSSTIKRKVLYPGYRLYPGFNDIAIIELAKPFKITQQVKPIRIAAPHEPLPESARVSGWGYTKMSSGGTEHSDSGYPDVLHFVDLKIIKKDECIKLHKNVAEAYAKHPRIICAGYLKGGKDTCQGDSGGPLVCLDTHKKPYLCGVVQAGIDCGHPTPGFYTQVSEVRDFIIQEAGEQKL